MSEFPPTITRTLKEDGDDFLNAAIRKWKFNQKFKRNLITFIVLGIFFLTFGIIFLIYNLNIVEVNLRYENECKLSELQECPIQFEIRQRMENPIFIYYQLENFFQTHRKFFQSKDSLQLLGEKRTIQDTDTCAPYQTNQEMGVTQSVNGSPLDPNALANPCGLIAQTYFNDFFQLFRIDPTSSAIIEEIVIDQTDIAWEVDRKNNYKRAQNWASEQWVDVEDEHFMVWMRVSGMGQFRKLWGRIQQPVEVGSYMLRIKNVYDIQRFSGQQSFVMTTTSIFGQQNPVLVAAYFIGALICVISLIILLCIYYREKQKAS